MSKSNEVINKAYEAIPEDSVALVNHPDRMIMKSIDLPPLGNQSYDLTQKEIQKLLVSNLVKVRDLGDAVYIAMYGKELGIPTVAALNNFHIVPSKSGRQIVISTQALAAMLRQRGIRYEIVKDNEIMDSTKPLTAKDDKGVEKVVKNPDGSIRYKKTYGTEIASYEFFNGKWFRNVLKYTMEDADNAGLSSKDNWIRMQPAMLRARCLAAIARFVAPEIMLGLYSEAEIAEDYAIDPNNLI